MAPSSYAVTLTRRIHGRCWGAGLPTAFEHLYDWAMGEAAAELEDDWDLAARLAGDLHDAHARLVSFMAGVISEGTWEGRGLRSPEHLLVLRAGLSQGQARAIVLMARRAVELPETARALQEGRISLDQAAVVARHTPPEFDSTVAEFAVHATVPQLQRSVARYAFAEPGGPVDAADDQGGTRGLTPPPEPEKPASLTMHHEDGRFVLRYDAPSEVGALVETALAEAKDWLFTQRSGSPAEGGAAGAASGGGPVAGAGLAGARFGVAGTPAHERVTVSWADALGVLASRSLESVETTSRRAKYRVHVFLDTDGGWLNGRPRLPKHLLDGLTCDGQLAPVWTTEGVPVSVGRSRRVVPERTRRLIVDRDRGCRFPGCAATAFVEIHHLVHWADGGGTDLDNLLSLCPFHHDGHHRREFSISGDPTRDDGLAFHSPYGVRIGPPGGARSPSPWSPALARAPLSLVPDAPPTDERGLDARGRPAPRTGRIYPAPAGHALHPRLVDFTPYPPLAPLAPLAED